VLGFDKVFDKLLLAFRQRAAQAAHEEPPGAGVALQFALQSAGQGVDPLTRAGVGPTSSVVKAGKGS
jgi:hypothetical protein